jgi:cytochrome c
MFSMERCRSNRYKVAVFATASFVAAASPATGAEDLPRPSPETGYALAQRFCNGCHLIDNSTTSTVPAGVPTFPGIANKPGQTGQHIMSVLIQPHPPMPDIHLSSEEIMNIVAYLETLRTDKSAPPLQAPVEQHSKPEYPEHS